MGKSLKSILQKLIEGETKFPCVWKGIPNECEILQIDLERGQVYVRFKYPVKVEHSRYEPVFGYEEEVLVKGEIDSYEEWVSINNYNN